MLYNISLLLIYFIHSSLSAVLFYCPFDPKISLQNCSDFKLEVSGHLAFTSNFQTGMSLYVSVDFYVDAAAAAAAAKSLQSCLTLCDPIDGSPPGSPVPGILQTRTLEWVAISFSNA